MDKIDNSLSTREIEILGLILFEYTTVEIAEKLFLSTDTIKSHRKKMFKKLKARNVAGLVRRAFEHNLIQLENN